jgi:hypothetical protein
MSALHPLIEWVGADLFLLITHGLAVLGAALLIAGFLLGECGE